MCVREWRFLCLSSVTWFIVWSRNGCRQEVGNATNLSPSPLTGSMTPAQRRACGQPRCPLHVAFRSATARELCHFAWRPFEALLFPRSTHSKQLTVRPLLCWVRLDLTATYFDNEVKWPLKPKVEGGGSLRDIQQRLETSSSNSRKENK